MRYYYCHHKPSCTKFMILKYLRIYITYLIFNVDLRELIYIQNLIAKLLYYTEMFIVHINKIIKDQVPLLEYHNCPDLIFLKSVCSIIYPSVFSKGFFKKLKTSFIFNKINCIIHINSHKHIKFLYSIFIKMRQE